MNIVNKTYVINLKHRTDRWNRILNDFKNTDLVLERWDAIYGNDLSDKQLANYTTYYCYHFCSPGLIGCWLSHFSLWKHIVENKETNVLILEDDAYPTKNFYKLKDIWKEIPENWDIVFLGCQGSCDQAEIIQYLYKLITGKNNKFISKHVMIPIFPLGFHGYMISYKGAKKLITHPKLQKVSYHIDYIFTKNILNDENFNVYAIIPPLIDQHKESKYSDIQFNLHPIINKYGSKIKISNFHTIDSFLGANVFYIKPLKINITFLVLILFIILIIMSIILPIHITNFIVFTILIVYSWEIIYRNELGLIYFKHIIFEIFVILFSVYLGYQIKNIFKKSFEKIK